MNREAHRYSFCSAFRTCRLTSPLTKASCSNLVILLLSFLSIEKRHSTADGFVLRPWCNLCPYAEIAACHCYTFLCACIIADFESDYKQPSLNTFTSFQLLSSFRNLLQPVLFLHSLFTPPPPSEPTEAVKGKRKKYCSRITKNRADLSGRFLCRQIGSMNFQRYFFPLDGGGGVLIQSIIHLFIR